MTLAALENKADRLSSGSWERDDVSVTLRWKNSPNEFFKDLFQASFKIKKGFFFFPAIGDPFDNPQHAEVLQGAILGTILQHVQTRKADSLKNQKGSVTVEIDGSTETLTFCSVSEYAHQRPGFTPVSANKLVGWLYPGGSERHTGLGSRRTRLENSPALALSLRYLPVGTIYFRIQRRGQGIRPRYAMVMPEIDDLARYAEARRVFFQCGAKQLYCAGAAEAGLRVLLEVEARKLTEVITETGCRVFSFGTVPWSPQQKTRVEIFRIYVDSPKKLRPFKFAEQIFKIKRIKQEGKESYWAVPQFPELVARNIVGNRHWWLGFADFVSDKSRREYIFRFERGGLAEMVADRENLPRGPERTFVEACHEAWRRRMGQLSERAGRENISFNDLARREFERARVVFSRCKNASAIRAAVTDFWARGGGPLPALRESWGDVIQRFDEQHWQKARDLALLALASYKPAGREEAEALEANQKEVGE